MSSIIQVVKENVGLIILVAIIFLCLGYLLGKQSVKPDLPNPELVDSRVSIHFFGSIPPKVISKKGEKIEPLEDSKKRPIYVPDEKISKQMNRSARKIINSHDITIEESEGSIRYEIWIDNIHYCFLLDEKTYRVVGSC